MLHAQPIDLTTSLSLQSLFKAGHFFGASKPACSGPETARTAVPAAETATDSTDHLPTNCVNEIVNSGRYWSI